MISYRLGARDSRMISYRQGAQVSHMIPCTLEAGDSHMMRHGTRGLPQHTHATDCRPEDSHRYPRDWGSRDCLMIPYRLGARGLPHDTLQKLENASLVYWYCSFMETFGMSIIIKATYYYTGYQLAIMHFHPTSLYFVPN